MFFSGGGGGSPETLIASGSPAAVSLLEIINGVGGVVWDDTYAIYKVKMWNWLNSATATPTFVFHQEGGAYLTANYASASNQEATFSTLSTANIPGSAQSVNNAHFNRYEFNIFNSRLAGETGYRFWGTRNHTGNHALVKGNGNHTGAVKIDGIKAYMSSGTFSCQWALYGLKGS